MPENVIQLLDQPDFGVKTQSKGFLGLESTVKEHPYTGLVLSGGGARGAYEAGVIQYLRTELPPEIQKKVISGHYIRDFCRSHQCLLLAANNHVPRLQGKALSMIWERLRIEGVYQAGWRELSNLPRFYWDLVAGVL